MIMLYSSDLTVKPIPVLHSLQKWQGWEMDQIGPKWDKSGLFKDQFQYILARRDKMYWN